VGERLPIGNVPQWVVGLEGATSFPGVLSLSLSLSLNEKRKRKLERFVEFFPVIDYCKTMPLSVWHHSSSELFPSYDTRTQQFEILR
jgi:hypothetical protein